jgi:hypothetical protein
MSLPLTGLDDAVFVALVAFLREVLPDLSNRQIMQGEQNSVPMPIGPRFVIIVPTGRAWQSGSVHGYRSDDGQRDTTVQTRSSYNINFYGPNAVDDAQIFVTLWRDMYACDFLRPYQIQPQWADDARQMPLVNDSKQYEQRYLVQAHLQVNPTVSTAQQFADTLAITILEAD